MSDPIRPKMPRLRRTGPIRNWGGLFGAPRDASTTDGATPSPPGPTPPATAVARGVDLGYRVIEEYMRQGEAFARANGSARSPGSPAAMDPRKLTERMVEYASDLASTWLEFVQATMPPASTGAAAARTRADPGGFDIGGAAQPRGESPNPAPETRASGLPWRTSIEIASRRRAEVTLDLARDIGDAPLCAHDLRARDPEIPRIRGITVLASPSDHRVLVRISVPDDQPPSIYTGVIVEDASNRPLGTLSVRIFE
jgi:hypothetical protein